MPTIYVINLKTFATRSFLDKYPFSSKGCHPQAQKSKSLFL